jgi:hypothetical protein
MIETGEFPKSAAASGWLVVIALGLAALRYFFFQAPVWCGAETRKRVSLSAADSAWSAA